uniref:BZIP domain-containing protein n=1 Tax=Clastoptera arizonana TaxID=38151 RepID=A0A1B6E4Z1_9HEMI
MYSVGYYHQFYDMYFPNMRPTPKYEPFSDWLEEKIDLPIFEDLPVAGNVQSNVEQFGLKGPGHGSQQPLIIPIPAATPHSENIVLIPEFDYILNDETLTPPESPREEMVLTMLQEMQPHELDELVRMRVESLVDSSDNNIESSRSSLQEESDSVSSPLSSDSGYEDPDPEWKPDPLMDSKVLKKRRITKPYSRTPPEEKKIRKKEQNKNAATRYRMKKKAEVEEILGEEKSLMDKNEQLKTDMHELAREIKYLKSLMKDVFKAKGLIK